MPDAPPTTPGPLGPAAAPVGAGPRILLSMAIQAGCVFVVCFAVPLAMESNIWPIAGVMWSVLTVPVAALTGALSGWLLRKARLPVAVTVFSVLGLTLAIAAGMIIARN